MSADERSLAAAEAASMRWVGGDLEPGQVEAVARSVFATWAALCGVNLARPMRNGTAVDEVAMAADLSWCAPVQIKGVARDGMTVWKKYVGSPIVLVTILLGCGDGGLQRREHTSMIVMRPDVAWKLPAELGMKVGPDSTTYRWPSIPQRLLRRLEPMTARTPDELGDLLKEAAPWPHLIDN